MTKFDRDFEREPARRRPRRWIEQLELLATRGTPLKDLREHPISNRCFACSGRAVGTRDLRPVGRVELACVDHADAIGGAVRP